MIRNLIGFTWMEKMLSRLVYEFELLYSSLIKQQFINLRSGSYQDNAHFLALFLNSVDDPMVRNRVAPKIFQFV